ncbi:MAG: hypothetical protein ACRCT8_17980 [Lacipirellulaceae bacterium]
MRSSLLRRLAPLCVVALAAEAPAFLFTAIDVPGATADQALGVNNAGLTVGSATGVAALDVAYAFDGATHSQFSSDLGAGALRTNYNGVADDGTTVGFWDEGSGASLVRTGFARTPGGMLTTLPFAPGSVNTTPLDRNESGVTVGTVSPGAGTSSASAFLYTGGPTFAVLYDHPGSSRTQFNSVNNAGDVVGRWADGSTTRGLIYRSGVAASYDLPGATNTHLFGVNDLGQVVGYYTSASFSGTRGFLLENALDADPFNDSFSDIVFPGSSAAGTRAYAINDSGTIVGTFNGFSRGFVAMVPEPAAGLIVPLGALAFPRRR